MSKFINFMGRCPVVSVNSSPSYRKGTSWHTKVKILKNRVLIIYKDGNWVQKFDLPKGKIGLSIDKKVIYD